MKYVLLTIFVSIGIYFPKYFLPLTFPYILVLTWSEPLPIRFFAFLLLGLGFDLLNSAFTIGTHALLFSFISLFFIPLQQKLHARPLSYALVTLGFFFVFQSLQILFFRIPCQLNAYFFDYLLLYPLKSAFIPFMMMVTYEFYGKVRRKSPTRALYRRA